MLLIASCGQVVQDKSLARLKGMQLMLGARVRAAIAAASAGRPACIHIYQPSIVPYAITRAHTH